MDALSRRATELLMDPSLRPLLAIVKSARNGAVYGAKVRFPHALVMVFLFRSGTVREKLKLVYKATRQHARNLATFATVYKTCMLLLRLLNTDEAGRGKEGPYDTFFSGLVGGYFVFGRGRAAYSSVNQQIVIYVFARVVLALAKLSLESPNMTSTTPTPTFFTQRLDPEVKRRIQENAWPVFASLSWAMVMYIFRWQPESIQSSLKSSMFYMPICKFGPLGLVEDFPVAQHLDFRIGLGWACMHLRRFLNCKSIVITQLRYGHWGGKETKLWSRMKVRGRDMQLLAAEPEKRRKCLGNDIQSWTEQAVKRGEILWCYSPRA